MRQFRRRDEKPSRWPTERSRSHETAREMAAERLESPLDPDASSWLDGHLASCENCAAVAASYEAERAELQGLRELPQPEPPRDLWARTAAALDLEGGRSIRSARSTPWISRLRPSPLPIAMLVGVLAIAVVVVGSFQGVGRGPITGLASSAPSVQAAAASSGSTPLVVHSGPVAWLSHKEGGSYTLNVSNVDRVCAPDAQPDCAPIDASQGTGVQIPVQPSTVVVSPAGKGQAIVVGKSGPSGTGSIYSINVPSPQPSPTSAPASPSGGASPSGSGSSSTPSTSGSSPSPSPSNTPPSSSPTTSASVSPSPSSPAATVPVSLPPGSPSPSAGAAPQPIISGVILVGQSATYSADGQWFAFTARPADGSHGPDIYLWHVSDPLAIAVTADHASVFSSWVGEELIGSRPNSVEPIEPARVSSTPSQEPSKSPAASERPSASATPDTSARPAGKPGASLEPTPGSSLSSGSRHAASPSPAASIPSSTPSPSSLTSSDPVSFLIDPTTWVETPLASPAWRPVVDQSGRFVVYWIGTLRRDPATGMWQPDQGRLGLTSWTALRAGLSGDPIPEPLPSSVVGSVTAGSTIPDWDIRWDPAGTHLGVWVADAADPTVGRLSLLSVDAMTGRLDPARALLAPTPALPGFALADGRLAWATPPGQNGQGSSLQVLAWNGNDRGRVETTPLNGSDAVVVIR